MDLEFTRGIHNALTRNTYTNIYIYIYVHFRIDFGQQAAGEYAMNKNSGIYMTDV